MCYNFGCIIASDTLFNSTGGFSGLSYNIRKNIADIDCLRVVAMATNFETKIAITGFVRMTATRQLVMETDSSRRMTECR